MNIHKCVLIIFSPVLPLCFDVLMPFYRLMGRCLPDELINFMAQYEATRTLSETLMESVPQLGVQVYMVVWCRNNTCNFEEDGDGELIQAFTVSIVSIIHRVVASWIEMKADKLTLCGYIEQLVKMGDGMPIASIKNNVGNEVKIEFELSLAQVRLLANALEHNTSIKVLWLRTAKIDDEKIELLAPALAKMEGLNTLWLDINNIGDEGCRHLAPALAEMKGLKKLSLDRNNIGDEGCRHLAPTLAKMKVLKELLLRSNNIGEEGCRHLAPALAKMKVLKELYLRSNNIGEKGCRHLAPALAKMKGLKELNLRYNNIGEEGEKVMREAWEKTGKENRMYL